jgi:FolB domain-containing protein
MDSIQICDFEVHYRVGVPEEERAKPQRLLVTVDMAYDVGPAAATDDIHQTLDYYKVCQRLETFGEKRTWKLLEKLASDIASMVLQEFHPPSVTVEIKKFIIPQARYVSVRVTRARGE